MWDHASHGSPKGTHDPWNPSWNPCHRARFILDQTHRWVGSAHRHNYSCMLITAFTGYDSMCPITKLSASILLDLSPAVEMVDFLSSSFFLTFIYACLPCYYGPSTSFLFYFSAPLLIPFPLSNPQFSPALFSFYALPAVQFIARRVQLPAVGP